MKKKSLRTCFKLFKHSANKTRKKFWKSFINHKLYLESEQLLDARVHCLVCNFNYLKSTSIYSRLDRDQKIRMQISRVQK